MPENNEALKVLAGYQQGWIDCLETIIRLAAQKLEEKIEEMKLNANTANG